jgi:hypothetical protein
MGDKKDNGRARILDAVLLLPESEEESMIVKFHSATELFFLKEGVD